jgi:predicted Fe-Mo cluster-binding NifX family protein
MKIAAVSDDGFKISQHFGRAPIYVVLTVEEGKILNKETRPKTGHHTFAAHEHAEQANCEKHGCDAGSQRKHASMAETISDCQVLLAGGMGWGAYESLKSYNIESIVTDVENIYKAVELYLKGKLPNLMDRLH